MSIFVSSLVLALLYFSTYTCNGARVLGMAHQNNITQEFQLSAGKKNDQKQNPGSVSLKPDRKYPVPDGPGEAKMENKLQGKIDRSVASVGSRRVPHKKRGKKEPGFHLDYSWRVPHKKRGEKEPGLTFNQDYLPPKTHPPVHN